VGRGGERGGRVEGSERKTTAVMRPRTGRERKERGDGGGKVYFCHRRYV
jgi:hypothetical protein